MKTYLLLLEVLCPYISELESFYIALADSLYKKKKELEE